ncbi:hypothetical protein R1sor_020880 [Riccia sorocarpa]|uniref:Uncharacterized protein n=1 Tax=Riccia sorocarpa TaxID=122646 RepID=A0ABD3GHK2_9MARC
MGYSDHRDIRLMQPMPPREAARSIQQFRRKPWRRVYGVSMPMKETDLKSPVQTLKTLPCCRNKARGGRYHKFKTRFPKRRMPCAPRNTTSFIMRANKFGIKAPFCTPLCPTALGTPVISPAPWPKELLGDGQVASDLGVNAYGSMNGCIRLKADAMEDFEVDGERDNGALSCNESVTDQCSYQPASSVQQVEERIDHCLQRFELLSNNSSNSNSNSSSRANFSRQSLYAKMEDQENHINYLEEVNLSLHQQIWAIRQELTELRRRLENQGRSGSEIVVTDESLGDGSSSSSDLTHRDRMSAEQERIIWLSFACEHHAGVVSLYHVCYRYVAVLPWYGMEMSTETVGGRNG